MQLTSRAHNFLLAVLRFPSNSQSKHLEDKLESMIKNALPKARPGVCRIPLRRFPVGAAAFKRPSLTSTEYGITTLNHSLSTAVSLQRRFSNVPARTSLCHHDDTIYALSTAPGRAAIAIIRISGPGWQDVRRPVPQAVFKVDCIL
jgi:hypothetical protein